MASIGVIGAGVGAMTSALRLAHDGHQVTVYEKNSCVGGKLASREINGFHFDTGPSLLTWPTVFRQLFSDVGLNLDDYVELDRLAHTFRYNFADGSHFDCFDDAHATSASIAENLGATSAREWEAFMAHSERVWHAAQATFLTHSLGEVPRLLASSSVRSLRHIDAFRSLASRSRSAFSDPRMQAWLNRYSTYSGSDPWRTPASVSCIPHLEQQMGAWHIKGGMTRLGQALHDAFISLGGHLHFGSDVERVISQQGRIGIQLAGNVTWHDAVVAGCDAEHLYLDLVSTNKKPRMRRVERSTSGFSMLVQVESSTKDIAHHNVWFGNEQRREFHEIANGSLASEPTVYACVSAVNDPTQAPNGCENWFVLVNTPPGAEVRTVKYGNQVLERLPLSDRIKNIEYITPEKYGVHTRSRGGAIYGAASNSRMAAFLRPNNKSRINGLFLAGGSTHPGGGLPLVAQSGNIAASLVSKYLEHQQ